MLTAGTASNASTRDLLISMVHKRASENTTSGAFPSIYDADTGAMSGGQARSVFIVVESPCFL